MQLKVTIVLFVFIGLATRVVVGQEQQAEHQVKIEVPEVALLGLVAENSTDVNLQVNVPNEAGEIVNLNAVSSEKIWVNYTSVISKAVPARKVVAFVEGELPDGIRLQVEASSCKGSGKGRMGTSAGMVTLSNQPTDVIVGIGTCYTGKGAQNGHFLSYRLEQTDNDKDFALIEEQNLAVNVVYTLTDYN
ncbi:hypothetical protein [uncultured Draconibacterium sp.]|uniref:hypothetical protein n=1 Tax=uncultured Draconibacterium sp. TaxID=1573823 RepID=UPI0025F6637D|nr:hypothetical protein [uncultured Draconibacterium sp.]